MIRLIRAAAINRIAQSSIFFDVLDAAVIDVTAGTNFIRIVQVLTRRRVAPVRAGSWTYRRHPR